MTTSSTTTPDLDAETSPATPGRLPPILLNRELILQLLGDAGLYRCSPMFLSLRKTGPAASLAAAAGVDCTNCAKNTIDHTVSSFASLIRDAHEVNREWLDPLAIFIRNKLQCPNERVMLTIIRSDHTTGTIIFGKEAAHAPPDHPHATGAVG